MMTKRILEEVDHRPWPLPSGPWIMTQIWHDLLFAHWPIHAEELRPLIPSSLEIDRFADDAWVGVVPFRMSGVRLRGTPALPWLSAFPELNVRTYIIADGKPGVWFFSLDAANALAVVVARTAFHLPYFRARMQCTRRNHWIEYASRRTHSGAAPATLRGHYQPTGPILRPKPGTLEHFLTERYCLYAADRRGKLLRCEIHHPPWLLQIAEAELTGNTMASASGITLPLNSPVLHFAQHQDVVVWPPQRLS